MPVFNQKPETMLFFNPEAKTLQVMKGKMKRQKQQDLIVLKLTSENATVTIDEFEWDPTKRYFMDGDMLYFESEGRLRELNLEEGTSTDYLLDKKLG